MASDTTAKNTSSAVNRAVLGFVAFVLLVLVLLGVKHTVLPAGRKGMQMARDMHAVTMEVVSHPKFKEWSAHSPHDMLRHVVLPGTTKGGSAKDKKALGHGRMEDLAASLASKDPAAHTQLVEEHLALPSGTLDHGDSYGEIIKKATVHHGVTMAKEMNRLAKGSIEDFPEGTKTHDLLAYVIRTSELAILHHKTVSGIDTGP